MLIKIKNYPHNFFDSIVYFKCSIPHDISYFVQVCDVELYGSVFFFYSASELFNLYQSLSLKSKDDLGNILF